MTSPGGQGRHFQVIWLSVLGTPKGQMVGRIYPVEYEIRISSSCELRYQCSAAVRRVLVSQRDLTDLGRL